MARDVNEHRKAGFWLRFTAWWLDTIVVVALAYSAIAAARTFAQYLPLELLVLILGMVYSTVLIGAKGRTLGKAVCGVVVLRKDGGPVGFLTAFLRECIAKPVLIVGVPVGLVVMTVRVVGLTGLGALLFVLLAILLFVTHIIQSVVTGRTWYDAVSGTTVWQDARAKNRSQLAMAAVLGISAGLIVVQAFRYLEYYRLYGAMRPFSDAPTLYDVRHPGGVRDVSSLAPEHDSLFVRWLDLHARAPVDYAVQVASAHQIVIFGEAHDIRSQVSFLIEAIPDLYRRAGVRCIAMEVCTREDNDDISRLVTAPVYDNELALRIARHQPWHTWGGKEYWDVLYAVWRLNRGLTSTDKKMRVVGIDTQWDGPSFALGSGGGDDAVQAPLWERLRLLRIIPDIPEFVLRDEVMAREVEQQIIDTGERGIVWCGAHHSFVTYRQLHGKGRMGYMLRQKHGDKVFQVFLHSNDLSPSIVDAKYSGPLPRMGDFVERIMALRHNAPAAFDVPCSPFESLRDSAHYYYWKQPSATLGDVASGYIFLEPRAQSRRCQWTDGFITPAMFAADKPFYEGRFHRAFANAAEVDTFLRNENGE